MTQSHKLNMTKSGQFKQTYLDSTEYQEYQGCRVRGSKAEIANKQKYHQGMVVP